jgi:hypothetical protein
VPVEAGVSANVLLAERRFEERLFACRSFAASVFAIAVFALGLASPFGAVGALGEPVPLEQPANHARAATKI